MARATRKKQVPGTPLPLEVRAAIKAMAEEVAEKVAKRVLYRSQEMQKKAIRESLSEVGFLVDDPEDRAQVVLDAMFIRDLRLAAKGRPAKVGFAILSTGLGVVGALITFAAQTFWGALFGKITPP
jgi:hypothetical protein